MRLTSSSAATSPATRSMPQTKRGSGFDVRGSGGDPSGIAPASADSIADRGTRCTSRSSSTASPTTLGPLSTKTIEPRSTSTRGPPSRTPRSRTVTIDPRRLMSPTTNGGVPGSRVAFRCGMISRTTLSSQAHVRPAAANTSRRGASGELPRAWKVSCSPVRLPSESVPGESPSVVESVEPQMLK